MTVRADRGFDVDPAMRHRTAGSTVRVLAPDGRPLAHTEVTVAQRRHRFRFGCIGFEFLPQPEAGREDGPPPGGSLLGTADPENYARLWFDVFNFATLPFYWAQFEPRRGRPDTDRLLRTARWFADHGCVVKGHPLAWHTLAPEWLLDLPDDDVVGAVTARVRRDVTDFTGVIDTWDAINEVVIMPVFDKYDNALTRVSRRIGRIGTIRTVFDEARAANPHATLLLNDFDMSTAFECLLEGCLEAGVRIDAIGLQSHMHQGYWGEERTLSVLERFARYGIPLHLTETTLVSGRLMPPEIEDLNDFQPSEWPSTPEGEARQADEIVRHYRTLLSHPAVEAITYWGLSDAGAWLGAPAGLVRADGTPKPAYDALRGLVKGEWWLAPTVLRTDSDGRVPVRGFVGEYQVQAGDATAAFELAADGPAAGEVRLARAA